MKRREPTQFRRLKKIWDERLEREGLPDIEDANHCLTDHKSVLDLYTLIGFKSTDIMESIRDYFTWAAHCLTLCRFKRERDRKVWALHSRGDSTWAIARHLKMHQRQVRRDLKRIRKYLQSSNPRD